MGLHISVTPDFRYSGLRKHSQRVACVTKRCDGIHVNHSDIQIEGAWLNHNGFHVGGELDGEEILIEGVGFAAYNAQIDLSQTVIVQNWIMGNSVDTVTTTIWGAGFLAKDSSQINASHMLIADNTVEQSGISICQGPLSILNSSIEVTHLRVLGNLTNCQQSIGSIAHLSANTRPVLNKPVCWESRALGCHIRWHILVRCHTELAK